MRVRSAKGSGRGAVSFFFYFKKNVFCAKKAVKRANPSDGLLRLTALRRIDQ